jgi:CHAT domain-containing protein
MFALLAVLPDTADELNAIAGTLKADSARDVYLGRKASETNVKRPGALDQYRVVAFATHGIAPGELAGLDQPALVLSNPALTSETDQDGFLTMEEVLGLKLDADWVVLSACNTASGEGKGADAVSGLGRAFFFAGARTLLVSNWAVETTSARLLTTELFRRQADDPRVSRAEAMRQSMLALIDRMSVDGNGGAGFSYAHPAFWAPFSLVGDSGARIAAQ